MSVSNPVEAIIGILFLLDDTRAKMKGTRLAEVPWRPESPESADAVADLVHEAFARCEDVTEAVIVVTVAAALTAARPMADRTDPPRMN